jgi:fumarylacetoacetate (FAA) hydrolase
VTPDELGDAWDGGKLHLPLLVELNGKPFGKANAGIDMTFDFGQLIAHAAKTRPSRRHDHRLGHGLQQARRRPGQAGPKMAATAIPASPRSALIETIEKGRRRRRSCISAIQSGSR